MAFFLRFFHRPWHLRTYLILLVVVAVLPLVIFAGVTIYISYQQQRANIEHGMIDTARALSTALDREFIVSIQALKVLATSDRLNKGQLSEFYLDMKEALAAYGPAWRNIALWDRTGQQLINLSLPFGSPLLRLDPELIAQNLQTGESTISNLFLGPLTNEPSMVVTVPVLKGGQVKYLLCAGFPPARLLDLLSQQKLPPGWIATIIDRNQIIAARTRDVEKYLGKPAAPTFAAQAKQHQEATWRGTTLEGTAVVATLHRSDLSGWTVGLAIPAAEVDALLNKSLMRIGAGGLALLLLGIMVALALGKRVATSITSLSNTAEALVGEDDDASGGGQQIAEVRQVARAMEDAASKRKQAEEHIRRLAKFPSENPNPVMRIGRNGAILYANQSSALILTEWAREVGQNAPDTCREQIAATLDSGISKEMEIECNGRIFSFVLAPIVAEEYVNVYGRDISERKRAEEALREAHEFDRQVITGAREGIIVYDRSLRYVAWNRFMEEFSGLRAEEVVGKQPLELFPFLRETGIYALLERALQGASGTSSDFHFTVPSTNKTGWASQQVAPLRNARDEIIGVIGTVTDITERKLAEAALTKTTEQLRALSGRLQRIREEERTSMAREIHDVLGQALTALKMDLASVGALAPKNNPLKEKIGGMGQLVDETIQTVRRIASELRPGILDDLGLAAALQWQAQEFHKRTGIRCRFASEMDSVSLEKDRSTTLFRICQEALTNVTRHAKATEVQITLGQSDHGLLLQVRDNGRGLKAGELTSPKALGLLGMQERAILVGGTCEISGEPGKGTTVTVRIPLGSEGAGEHGGKGA